jgi:hypothetical protein
MHPLMIRIALALSILALVAAPTAGASGPAAHAAGKCKLTRDQQFHSGSTYLISLSVSGVSCSTGLKVEKAWQACRKKTSGHRVCKSRVLGYKSTYRDLGSIKTQINYKVTCTNGSRKVVFVFQQNF